MGRLMSIMTAPNNIHDSNPIYNYKFPTSTSNNFSDNYFLCGYKCKKNSDRLIFEGEKYLRNFEVSNYLPPKFSFSNDGVKPITISIYSHRKTFKITQSDGSNNIKLQFLFDADYDCQIDIFYCAFEKFSNGLFRYTLDSKWGRQFTSSYLPGPNQLFEYEFSNLENFNVTYDVIPFVVLLSTLGKNYKDNQQFVTHLCLDSRSDNLTITNLQVTVQKLVYNQTCFLIQEMYGADLLTEQEVMNSTMKDLSEETSYSISSNRSNKNQRFLMQDCVICMASVRNTLVLPCRHLCLCGSCGDKLLHQSPTCPICRCTFRALLQIGNFDRYVINNVIE